MRILVTGGRGFLGTYICERLAENTKYQLIIPSHSEYDLCDPVAVEQLFSSAKPEMVIHAAGHVGGIKDAREHPVQFYEHNMLMGLYVQRAAARYGVQKFVGVGSACEYPEHAPLPLKEEDLWMGYPEKVNSPYGFAKKMLYVQGKAYRDQQGFHGVHLVLANLYGPGDNFDPETSHVVPGLIRKMTLAKEEGQTPVVLWGDGTPTRELLHARDAARGIVLAMEQYDGLEPVNIGASEEVSVRDLASIIAKEVGFTGEIRFDTSVPNGQPRRCLNTEKAAERFGFRSQILLRDGLRETIAWWNAQRKKA